MLERPKSGERAILVHITFPHGVDRADLREFTELAIAAGAYPVATVTGVRDVPDAKYFIGSGKIDELFHLIQGEKADVVLFNHELSPAQERNVEKKIQCRVLSRTGLILDIFAQRARTFEGKLQVELAQLEHLSTRLVRGWTHLERQKGGIGLRGPGETQLETDRRLIRVRIKRIQDKLEKVAKQRHLSRRKRQREAIPTVALVGYTNAGKSTLFNWLTGSDAFVANQLFATLDPTIRTLQLPQIGNIVLVDTVGFIRQLPHQLVNAFRATLEETRQADLLLHVVDAHDEASTANMEHVNVVLREIGADEVPQLIVYNKVDLQKDSAKKLNTHEKDVHGN
ncbi:MAG TPA: ribosome rescue GTPase HflX, partial [Gammaproteobacteria bacterium]|nr:ribosome rescue GTPase HflX [Gammaproteobacteria bacterium]